MNKIETHLHEHFASLDDSTDPPPASGAPGRLPVLPDSQAEALDEAFAKVNTVAAGSPAERAGLKAGDEIRNFGYVNRANHDNLKRVAECVQGNEGVGLLFVNMSTMVLTVRSKTCSSRFLDQQVLHSAKS